jgi:hypothetical protein
MSLIKLTFRLDDAHENFNRVNWDRCIQLIEQNGVPGLIGVIPLCLDKSIDYGVQHMDFKEWCEECRNRGWTFAHHGYTHILREGRSLLIRYANKGEFTHSSFDLIVHELNVGKALLKNLGIETNVFFAPRHSYSKNLLKALKYTGFEVVSDGISNSNFYFRGVRFIPQYLSFPSQYLFKRSYTICLHPSTMNEFDFTRLEEFLIRKNFVSISWDDILIENTRIYNASLLYRIFYSIRYRRFL